MEERNEVAELLNKIRWNEGHLKFKVEVSFIPEGLVKEITIPFGRIEFGDKDTKVFMIRNEDEKPIWIPFERVTDIYKTVYYYGIKNHKTRVK